MTSSEERCSPITGRHGILCFALLALLSTTAVPYAAAQPTTETGTADQYQYANFSPSMAIIIVVLISALFLMGFFSIYIRHCSERNGASVRAVVAGQGVGRSRRANRGIDPALLETFPTFAYSAVKGLKIGKGALECAVCLNEFEDDEKLRLLPKCDHVFHPECIDAWLSTHTTCPVCRANLALVDGETPVAGEVNIPTTTAGLEDDSDESTHGSNANELQNSVSIRVVDNQNGDDQAEQVPGPVGLNPSRSVNQNRPPRSRSVKSFFYSKFPRSHSTGHSLVQPGENVDRFTLRLPDDIRKQIMSRALNRTTSLLVLPRETSTRRGYRTGEGSSRGKSYRRLESLDQVGKSDRWVFSMAPPFFVRAPSVKSPKTMANDGEGTSSMPPTRGFISSLKKSFGRLNSKGFEPGLASADSARPPV